MERGRGQLEDWFRRNVLQHAVVTDTDKADQVRWDKDNAIFADVLLRADEDEEQDEEQDEAGTDMQAEENSEDTALSTNALGIPLNTQSGRPSRAPSQTRKPRRSKLFPCHRAMLIRSDFFLTMFSSTFREAQPSPHLQIIPIACSPAVLEIILSYLYTEKADFPLSITVDVLFAADLLFLDKLKMRAAVVISTLGNGTASALLPNSTNSGSESEEEAIDIYEILHAAWSTRVQRLEEFAARYIAYRLEAYIDDPEFAEIVKESAGRISARQETDSIELLDDIRWYLSERFRLRFEDSGLENMMDEDLQQQQQQGQGGQEQGKGQHSQPKNEEEVDGPTLPIPHWGSGPVLQHPQQQQQQQAHNHDDEGVDMRPPDADSAPAPSTTTAPQTQAHAQAQAESAIIQQQHQQPGAVRTLDGDMAGDEFASDAINYQVLLGKIDQLLERLKLDA